MSPDEFFHRDMDRQLATLHPSVARTRFGYGIRPLNPTEAAAAVAGKVPNPGVCEDCGAPARTLNATTCERHHRMRHSLDSMESQALARLKAAIA